MTWPNEGLLAATWTGQPCPQSHHIQQEPGAPIHQLGSAGTGAGEKRLTHQMRGQRVTDDVTCEPGTAQRGTLASRVFSCPHSFS